MIAVGTLGRLRVGLGTSRLRGALGDLIRSSAAAYSVDRINPYYGGSAIRVRRSLDNAESDIGFTPLGILDTVALLAHCGAGSGFVTTWYDQSVNVRNATQTTAAYQPRIVSSGVVELLNSKPIINFLSGTFLRADDFLGGNNNSDATLNTVGTSRIGRGLDGFGQGWSIAREIIVLTSGGAAGYTLAVPASGDNRICTSLIDQGTGSSVIQQFLGGVGGATSTVPKTTLRQSTVGISFGQQNGNSVPGSLAECVFFSYVISASERQLLERSQGARFGIPVA